MPDISNQFPMLFNSKVGKVSSRTEAYSCPSNTRTLFHTILLTNISKTKSDVVCTLSVFLTALNIEVIIMKNILIPYGGAWSLHKPLACISNDKLIISTENQYDVSFYIDFLERKDSLNSSATQINRSGKPLTNIDQKVLEATTGRFLRIFSLYVSAVSDETEATVDVMISKYNGETEYILKDTTVKNNIGTLDFASITSFDRPLSLSEYDSIIAKSNKNNALNIYFCYDDILLNIN